MTEREPKKEQTSKDQESADPSRRDFLKGSGVVAGGVAAAAAMSGLTEAAEGDAPPGSMDSSFVMSSSNPAHMHLAPWKSPGPKDRWTTGRTTMWPTCKMPGECCPN